MICVISNNNNDNNNNKITIHLHIHVYMYMHIHTCIHVYMVILTKFLARKSCKIVEAIPAAIIIMHSLC